MIVLGLDEVGRGCWAGPLVAGAVVLDHEIAGLTDSKLLSRKQRETFDAVIRTEARAIGLGWVTPIEVDELGLTAAVALAMERAIAEIGSTEYESLIIDGNYNFLPGNALAKAVIKADLTIPAVSAASIVAKVARDNYMRELCAIYPQYGFDKHVGYGTKLHLEMLKLHGVSDIHRLSFKPVRSLAV